jgi:tetratricopeptide (TPR) repeat protein
MQNFALTAIVLFAAANTVAGSVTRSEIESLANVKETFRLACDYLWQLDDYYWHQGQYERCIAILRLITQLDPHDTDAYGSGAWLMQNQLRDGEAELFLLEGLRNNQDVYDIYFELGFFCYLHERFEEAISYLENALCLDPPARVYHLLAHCYEHVGDIAQAINVWTICESAEPENLVPYIQIDRILRGGKPSQGPALARKSREERMRERSHK